MLTVNEPSVFSRNNLALDGHSSYNCPCFLECQGCWSQTSQSHNIDSSKFFDYREDREGSGMVYLLDLFKIDREY